MKVTVREAAEDDLDQLADWIATNNLRAARDMVARIRDQINLLEVDGLEHRGRPGLVAGTREVIEHPYIIVYRVDEERREVTVLSIVHGAKDR
jgi:plasmid stabilization system protein ParE